MAERLDFRAIKRTFRPNQYLTCPAGWNDGEAHEVAPEFPMPAAALRDAWIDTIENSPRIEKRCWDEKTGYFDLIQRSAFLRFPDLITCQVVELTKNRSTLAIYSRSTYGYSDLGVNKARVKAWLATIENALGEKKTSASP